MHRNSTRYLETTAETESWLGEVHYSQFEASARGAVEGIGISRRQQPFFLFVTDAKSIGRRAGRFAFGSEDFAYQGRRGDNIVDGETRRPGEAPAALASTVDVLVIKHARQNIEQQPVIGPSVGGNPVGPEGIEPLCDLALVQVPREQPGAKHEGITLRFRLVLADPVLRIQIGDRVGIRVCPRVVVIVGELGIEFPLGNERRGEVHLGVFFPHSGHQGRNAVRGDPLIV